jgi:type VI secretion system protein ImpG
MEIYSVDQVTGMGEHKGERKTYPPFFAFSHAQNGGAEAYFQTRRCPSVIDDGLDTYLAIVTPRDAQPRMEEEIVSVEVTCTNRSLPVKLRVGDIQVPTAGSPTTAKFKNVTGVTNPVRPPLGSELHWRIVSHLALSHRSLGDAGTLRAFLELYNFDADEQLARTNHLRIDAIRNVDLRPARRLLEGAPIRGAHVTIELEEKGFAGRGDAFLFGAVLDELLAQQVTLNSFTELTIQLEPSKAVYSWSPRSGRRTIV